MFASKKPVLDGSLLGKLWFSQTAFMLIASMTARLFVRAQLEQPLAVEKCHHIMISAIPYLARRWELFCANQSASSWIGLYFLSTSLIIIYYQFVYNRIASKEGFQRALGYSDLRMRIVRFSMIFTLCIMIYAWITGMSNSRFSAELFGDGGVFFAIIFCVIVPSMQALLPSMRLSHS